MTAIDQAQAEALLLRGEGESLPLRLVRALRRFVRHEPLGAIGALVIIALLIVGLFPSAFAPHSYKTFDLTARMHGPSSAHLFGTDDQGRDVFSRVIFGAQTSILIGFGAVGVAMLVSAAIGIVTGYYGGLVDLLFQRLIDIWMAFPGLIFIIFMVGIFGHDDLSLILTMGALLSAGSSRVIRSVAMAVKSQPYIEAVRAVGAQDRRVLLRYVLPNVLPIIIVNVSVQVGAVILLESSLSFLGFGVPPPFPSWGRMLQDAQKYMQYHPYLALFPGLAIALVVYAFNMFGDALRDVVDPRLRGTR